MKTPPPLTREELIEIQHGHRRNADVWRLLHDIRRLRSIVLKARQYMELKRTGYDHADQIGESLWEMMQIEPCIKEDDQLRAELRDELRKAGRK